jgi:hypothetical protein
VPQKLYVYLRLGRPVLAICPPGEAADLVAAAGGGSLVVDPADPEGHLALRPWLERLARGELAGLAPDPAVVRRFDRRVLAERLAQALGGLAGRRALEV